MQRVRLFHFDDPTRFPILRTYTTATCFEVTAAPTAAGTATAVRVDRDPGETGPLRLALVLPLAAVTGRIDGFGLEVARAAGGCTVALEASDAVGRYVRYHFSATDEPARLRSSVGRADGSGSAGSDNSGLDEMVLPIQPLRLVVTLPAEIEQAAVTLVALDVMGDVCVAPGGIAGGG